MSRIGRERGWPPLSRAQFDQGRGPRGHLMVGTPDEAIAKILAQHEVFGHQRYLMQMAVGNQPQAAILRSIELFWHGGRAQSARGTHETEGSV
jgi:alkanesulfonate monooxygenase SsuD/methylene tetrahydromethanopterin reductase-like flavin-dependent oxidoreductase (luciferase family)